MALSVATSSPVRAAGPTSSPLAALGQVVSAFHGHASVEVVDPRSAARFAWDEDRVVPAASLYKLGVMIEAYREDASGLISLDLTTVDILDDDMGDDDYITPPGTTLVVRDAVERMITLSDNSSARALVRTLDAHRINDTLAGLGLRNTKINTGLPPAEQTAPYNTTTARDVMRLFLAMYRGTAVSAAASEDMLTVLARQQVNDRLPAGLPDGTVIAHKTGDLDGVAHDAGLIYTPAGPRIAVVLATDFSSYNDVVELDRSIASLTYAAPLDPFAPRFSLVSPPAALARGALKTTISVTNAASVAWSRSVALTVRLQASTAPSPETLARFFLPPLEPGSSTVFDISVPNIRPGTYLLQLDVRDEEIETAASRFPIVFTVDP